MPESLKALRDRISGVLTEALDDLDSKQTTAIAWGDVLLKELEPVSRRVRSDATVRS